MSVPAIQNWKPKHTQIVFQSISGVTNKALAKQHNYTEVRISQILNDPQAAVIRRDIEKSLRRKMEEDIENKLVILAEKSVRRLDETLATDFTPGSKAKNQQDNVAVSVLKGTGFLSKDFSRNESSDRPPLNERLAERLVTALEESNTAREQQVEVENAIDTEYEVVGEVSQ